mmetsp:Transcript_37886/g.110979  ORF Transcript_37886/g.110979 Transcript_37886/m.110979 type:complete len:116 (-) Transcript_37886:63-410(-)
MIFYESARCLHGRPEPLRGHGAYYVNMFMHFRPRGQPGWWHEEGAASAAAHDWAVRHQVAAVSESARLVRRRKAHAAIEEAHASLVRRAVHEDGTAAAEEAGDAPGEAWKERVEL